MSEQKKNAIVIGCILAIAIIMGILGENYLITALFIGVCLGAIYFLKDKSMYNLIYALLLVSLIFDYTLYVPKIESVYMFHIMLGIFALMTLYKIYKEKEIIQKLNKKILLIYVIWFIYGAISIFWAINKSLSIKYIAIYIMMFTFIFCMMVYNISKDRVNQTINLLLYLVSVVVVIGTIEVLLGEQLPVKHYIDGFADSLPQWQINTINARPIVFSYNTNNLNALLSLLIPFCLFSIFRFKNVLLKIWFCIISIISFGLIVITTSRTGYVSFLFGFVVFIIYYIVNIKNLGIKQMIYPIAIILGLVLAYNYAPNFMNIKPIDGQKIEGTTSLSGKLQSLIDISNDSEVVEKSTLNRMAIIKDVVGGVFKEKNFLGFGIGNVEQYIKDQGNSGNVYSPHCYPIEILGDFGVVGVLLFGVYYLYLLLGNLYKGIKKKDTIGICMVSILIAFMPASFGPSSITYVFSYWVVMALAASNLQVKQDNI